MKKQSSPGPYQKRNQCPFCIDAHYAAVRAVNAQNSELETWALASVDPSTKELKLPPFSIHYAEYIFGTLVASHYLNRMVSVFLHEKIIPMHRLLDPVTHSMAKIIMGGWIKKDANNVARDSISLLADLDNSFAWKPIWA